MTDTRPRGRRYSHVYSDRGDPSSDSNTARRRIANYIGDKLNNSYVAGKAMAIELGAAYIGPYAHDWRSFLGDLTNTQFLDAISIVADALGQHVAEAEYYKRDSVRQDRTGFITFAQRVFHEENLAFEIDDDGGVHPIIDAVFHNDAAELIKNLNATEYGNAKLHFESALQSFDARPPNTRASVRSAFETVEELVSLLISDKLNRGNLENKLTPIVLAAYPTDDPEAWTKTVKGWADWVDGVHQYRHAQGTEQPAQPSLSLCVNALSTAATIARTLIEAHQRAKKSR